MAKKRTYASKQRKRHKRKLYVDTGMTSKILTLRRTIAYPILVNSTIGVGSGILITAQNIPQFSEITALFQEYRILKARANFYNLALQAITTNPQNVTTGVNGPTPMMYVAYDPNDASAPGTALEVQAFANNKFCNMLNTQPGRNGAIMSYTFKPKIAVPVFQGLTNPSGYFSKFGQWISTDYNKVEHYGLKVFTDAVIVGTANYYQVEIDMEIWFQCRGIK